MLHFIHLSATGVAEIAESTNLKGCPHTFVYTVYVLAGIVYAHCTIEIEWFYILFGSYRYTRNGCQSNHDVIIILNGKTQSMDCVSMLSTT